MRKYRIRVRPKEGDYFIQEKDFLFWKLSEKMYKDNMLFIYTYSTYFKALGRIESLKKQYIKEKKLKKEDKKYKREILL